jgi:hypothetical protein
MQIWTYLNIIIFQQSHIGSHLTNLGDVDHDGLLKSRVLVLVESAIQVLASINTL